MNDIAVNQSKSVQVEMNQVIMAAERIYKQFNMRAKVINTLSSAQERLITVEAEAVTTSERIYKQQSKVNAEIRQGTQHQHNFNNSVKQGVEEQKRLNDEISKGGKSITDFLSKAMKSGMNTGKKLYGATVGEAMALNKMEQTVMARSGSPEMGAYYIQDWKKTANKTGTDLKEQLKLGLSFMPQVKNPRQINDLMKLSQQLAAFDISGQGTTGAAGAIKGLMSGDASLLSKQMDIPKSVIENKFGLVDAAKSGDLDRFIQKFKEMLDYMSMGEKQYRMLMESPAMKAEAAINGFKNSLAEASMTAMRLLAPQIENVTQWLQSSQGQTFFMNLSYTIATVTNKVIEFIQWLNEGNRAVSFLTQLASPEFLRIASILGLVALGSKVIVPALGMASQGLAILSGWITQASVSTATLAANQTKQLTYSQLCMGSSIQQATATGALTVATSTASGAVTGLTWAVRGLSIALKAASVVGLVFVLADLIGMVINAGDASNTAAGAWSNSMYAMDASTMQAAQNIQNNLHNMASSAIKSAKTINAATGLVYLPSEVKLNPNGGGTVLINGRTFIKDKDGEVYERKQGTERSALYNRKIDLSGLDEVRSGKYQTTVTMATFGPSSTKPLEMDPTGKLYFGYSEAEKLVIEHNTNFHNEKVTNPVDINSVKTYLGQKYEDEKRKKMLDDLQKDINSRKPDKPIKLDRIDTVDTVKRIEEAVEIGSEDIKVMRELAEMRHIQNFVTLTPTVQVTTGDINHATDIDTIINRIEDKLEEQFIGAAQGVYEQ